MEPASTPHPTPRAVHSVDAPVTPVTVSPTPTTESAPSATLSGARPLAEEGPRGGEHKGRSQVEQRHRSGYTGCGDRHLEGDLEQRGRDPAGTREQEEA